MDLITLAGANERRLGGETGEAYEGNPGGRVFVTNRGHSTYHEKKWHPGAVVFA